MEYGFVKVAAATPQIEVANCRHNREQIIDLVDLASNEEVEILVFPELCLTGYTCDDLFLQDTLIKSAKKELMRIVEHSHDIEALIVVGLPFLKDFQLYNVAAIIQSGKLLALIPKINLVNHGDMNEDRYFTSGNLSPEIIRLDGLEVPFGANVLLTCKNMNNLVISAEVGEDLWAPISPSSNHALAGARLILNPSASPRTIGKDSYRRDLVSMQSAKLIAGYIQADAGEGESTTDLVFSGHNIIAENGEILEEENSKYNKLLISDIDVDKLSYERRRDSTYKMTQSNNQYYDYYDYYFVDFEYRKNHVSKKLTRKIKRSPFIAEDSKRRDIISEEILNIQAQGLKKRLEHINTKHAVLGLSGGLDSTLALLVTKMAYDLLGLDAKGIICVTMPCFGTTNRTYDNAIELSKQIGTTLREIPIEEAVTLHFKDIGHDINNHDITYENAQARERTQVLMDLSNQYNGIVVGTGDLSELVLGWATYNGDHMSMYAVNASVPKTLVRYLVKYYGDKTDNIKLKKVLCDILDTPVSPELLPPVNGKITQKTEQIVGPYELHDFFLFYVLRHGFMPSKVYYLANVAFGGLYDKETIYKWLNNFYRRFFAQQFKRSCLPDGPKIGSIGVSPRGDLKMPSDASAKIWLDDLERCNL